MTRSLYALSFPVLLGFLWFGGNACADASKRATRSTAPASSKTAIQSEQTSTSPLAESPAPGGPLLDLLAGIQSGQLDVNAEGTGDGGMTLTVKNRTSERLRVVLPTGLLATGVSGQFGGFGGGRGGRGGGGRGGGGRGGMGMGGMGMGGMGMGGGGGMGMGMGGTGNLPSSMGLMMVSQLIMSLAGDRDSWDQSTLMSGMMGGRMGGMGMGGMGMGGSRGMMGRGGGFRSVPAGNPPETLLKPRETQRLRTEALSLDAPLKDGSIRIPPKGERLKLRSAKDSGIDPPTVQTLERLNEANSAENIAQLVLWKSVSKRDWNALRRVSQGWASAGDLALAQRFEELSSTRPRNRSEGPSGYFFWESTSSEGDGQALQATLEQVAGGQLVFGLRPQRGVPDRPPGPALACRLQIDASQVLAHLAITDPVGKRWISKGSVSIPIPGSETTSTTQQTKAEAVWDTLAETLLQRIIRAQYVKGTRSGGASNDSIRIDNASPLVLHGVGISGPEAKEATPYIALGGIQVGPGRGVRLPVSKDLVQSLTLKKEVRVIAAGLDGL